MLETTGGIHDFVYHRNESVFRNMQISTTCTGMLYSIVSNILLSSAHAKIS